MVLVTDRRIGFWEAANQPRSIDYPFTVIELRLNRGMTQSEIADKLGISQMHVSRLLAKTLSTLREGLEG